GNITGSYQFLGENTLKLSFNPRWMKQYSDRANFSTTSAWDLNYGVNLTLNKLLPWKLKFDTSFQLRTRTGYNAAEMNTTEYVWSAQLSRSFDNRFTLTVEGFDILGSVKNISRHITSQGFYENWYNALPSYVMAKFSYRFHIYPKKR
ncbi:MAG: outer membrane beta-barrel protein, partial [Paramuribaculum sp.]|nr:outer membrane beta-barrel protein [Paramuribaculum sp.]